MQIDIDICVNVYTNNKSCPVCMQTFGLLPKTFWWWRAQDTNSHQSIPYFMYSYNNYCNGVI